MYFCSPEHRAKKPGLLSKAPAYNNGRACVLHAVAIHLHAVAIHIHAVAIQMISMVPAIQKNLRLVWAAKHYLDPQGSAACVRLRLGESTLTQLLHCEHTNPITSSSPTRQSGEQLPNASTPPNL